MTYNQVDHTSNIFLRSNTRPKIFITSNTRPISFSGRTHDQNLSQIEHITNIIFRSHTRPKTFSGPTHDQNLSQVKHIRTFSQVNHTARIFLRSTHDQTHSKITTWLRACLHGGRRPQIGEVTCGE